MRKLNQAGSLVVPLVLVSVLLMGALGFGIWAYAGMQDYKNNVDQKVASAQKQAEADLRATLDAEFAEKEKQPLKNYIGPESFGTLTVSYPKTWSAYVADGGTSSTPVKGYFHPAHVPDITADVGMALKVEIVEQSYANVLKSYDGFVKSGKVTAAAYRLPKVPSVLGTALNGEVVTKRQGKMIIVPLRDKTIKVWTENTEFIADFDGLILPNLSFVP